MAFIRERAKTLDIGHHHLLSEQQAALGRRLAELAPKEEKL